MKRKITIDDEIYPKLLKEIENPPKALYGMGNWELLKNRKVAIVGSRKTTDYGRWVSRTLGEKLSKVNVTVVSGLAVGIDKEAHLGAVKGEGSTIAVLGAGLDINYPAANREIRKIIEQKGLVLTEFEDHIKADRFNFPKRNRIISGLCEKTVVVEGGAKSGAVLTAEIAAEQNREVYAVPGNINSTCSLGTNKLIKDGCTPLVILDELILDLELNPLAPFDNSNFGQEELKIMEIVRKEGSIEINKLHRVLKMDIAKINGIITVLEIKGAVFTALGKIFVAKL